MNLTVLPITILQHSEVSKPLLQQLRNTSRLAGHEGKNEEATGRNLYEVRGITQLFSPKTKLAV